MLILYSTAMNIYGTELAACRESGSMLGGPSLVSCGSFLQLMVVLVLRIHPSNTMTKTKDYDDT